MIDGFKFDSRKFAKVNINRWIDLLKIQRDFDQVPIDAYVQDRTRDKDIARILVKEGIATKSSHEGIYHPINADTYGGYASREYPEIPSTDIPSLFSACKLFAEAVDLDQSDEILVQRQRVRCIGEMDALTVQEGPHKDGVRKLGILCINRMNVQGGISRVYDNERRLIFEYELRPGDMLLLDDRAFWHDATPIRAINPQMPAFRDVVILTTPSDRQPR